MKSQLTVSLCIIIVFTIVSCSDDTSNSQETHIYPLTIGNQWIYYPESEYDLKNDTITIDSTRISSENKTAYHINGDDDYTFGVRNLFYEGNTLYGWDGSSNIADSIFDENILPSLTFESVTVPAGTFDAYKFLVWEDTSAQEYTFYWLVKGVGVVKVENESYIRQLVKYTVK